MNILVIQLARFGDVVQSFSAIDGLRKKFPNAKINLLVRSTFSDIAKLNNNIDKVIELPTSDILSPFYQGNNAQSLTLLTKWLVDQRKTEYDLLFNLTFSETSSYLATALRAKERKGYFQSLSNHQYILQIRDQWSQYVHSNVLLNQYNCIHLNDLFQLICEVQSPPASPKQSKLPAKRMIGLQITASKIEKTLSLAVWQNIITTLIDQLLDYEFYFFGSERDQPFLEAVLAKHKDNNRIHKLYGKITLSQTLDYLANCQWVISPDTSIVHLASLVNNNTTKIIELAIGQVRPEETGPYGNGHHVLYPIDVNSDLVADEILNIIHSKPVHKNAAHSITNIIKTSDGWYRNELKNINFDQDEIENFFTISYYLLARFRCSGMVEEVPVPVLGKLNQINSLDKLTIAYDALCTLNKISEFGQNYCVEMLNNIDDSDKLNELMAKLNEVDELLNKTGSAISLIKPLVDICLTAKNLTPIDNPVSNRKKIEELVLLSESSYRELSQNVAITTQLIESAVQNAQARLENQNKTNSQPLKNLTTKDLE